MTDTASSVGDVLDTLQSLAESEDAVTVGDVTRALGKRGFGPLILAPALIVITPIGGIPAIPTLMAIIIALFSVQIVLQRDHLWLPSMLKERAVEHDKVSKSVSKLRGLANWLDDHMGNRLTALTRTPMPTIAASIILGLCLLVPPAEVIPFAAALPMGAIAITALALTLKDGVVMLFGLIGSAAALWLTWSWAM